MTRRRRCAPEDAHARLRRQRRHARTSPSAIPDGGFTAIVGPNACGKSTLLRALVRMLKPREGSVLLDGEEISLAAPREQVALRLGLLPQTSTAPDGITVADLVARGRHPHQRLLRQWSREDERAVRDGDGADRTSTTSPTGWSTSSRAASASACGWRWRSRRRRRCCCSTSRRRSSTSRTRSRSSTSARSCTRTGRTLVAVLHDLNHACRYATHLIAMRDGAIVAEGDPARDRRRRARRVRVRAALPSWCRCRRPPARRWSCRRRRGSVRRGSSRPSAASSPSP